MTASASGDNDPFATGPNEPGSGSSGEVVSGEIVSGPTGGTSSADNGRAHDDSGHTPDAADGSASDGQSSDSDGPRYLKAEPLGRNPLHRDYYVPPGVSPTFGPGATGGAGSRAGGRTHFTYVTSSGGYGVRGPGMGPGMAMPDLSSVRVKNPLLAGVLGLFLGPIGLLYANIPWAIGLGLIAWLLLGNNLWLLLPPVWILCGLVGFFSALRTNAVRLTETMQKAAEEANGGRPGQQHPGPLRP